MSLAPDTFKRDSAPGHVRAPLTGPLLAALLVAVAAILPYLSTLDNYFVADDFGVVQLLARKPVSYFPRWFTTPWLNEIWPNDEIRPFPALTYQLTALCGAASPVANHVLNIAIHAGNGWLVLAAAWMVARLSLVAAAFAAVLFVSLPVHADSVAWITGRVDTLPAFFYLASFLAYARWRVHGSRSILLYGSSLVLFFLALFSKQNTITMVATLVLYDALLERRLVRPTWSWLRPYLPFVALTVAYLLLRYELFGEVARESQLGAGTLERFGFMAGRHLKRVMFGSADAGWLPIVAATLGVVVWSVGRKASGRRLPLWRAVMYFGPIWWFIGVAPVAVATYESTRHAYLASVGWAVLLGIGIHLLWHAVPQKLWRVAALVGGGLLLGGYSLALHDAVAEWNAVAAVSRKAVRDLEREALAAPEGSLLIVGAPVRSWEWALPFVAQPPFASVDLTGRVFVISPMLQHCCRVQWAEQTRRTLLTWLRQTREPPVLVLRWEAGTGTAFRPSPRDEPILRSLVPSLLETDTEDALDTAILRILTVLAAEPVAAD